MSLGVPCLRPLLALGLAVFAFLAGAPPARAAGGSAPAPPQWVGADDLRGKARLTWVRNPAISKVRVYRRAPGESVFSLRGEAVENKFVDVEVTPGARYAYLLRAVDVAGVEGEPSMEITVAIAVTQLLPPVPPEWEGFLPVDSGVNLRWSEQVGRDVVAYNVYRRAQPDPEFTLLGSTRATSYRDDGLVVGRAYFYVLTALDSSLHETARSHELEVSLSPPSPSAGEPAPPPSWKVRRTRLVAIVTEGEGTGLLRPADVAAGPITGDFYLADSGRRRIMVYSREGVFKRSISGDNGGFRNLLGLAVDSQENIYGVDAGRGVVQAYGRGGRPGPTVEVALAAPGQPSAFIDAAVSPDGGIFVVDNRAGRVTVIPPAAAGGARAIGGRGGAPGQFSSPTYCAIGPDKNLYVSDALNARVQVFSGAGEFRAAFGTYRRGPGGFGRPKGVAVSASGEVYVADSWLNVVQVFDREGSFVALLADEEGRPLDLGSPNGIALGWGDRTIAIAERLSARMQIRELANEP